MTKRILVLGSPSHVAGEDVALDRMAAYVRTAMDKVDAGTEVYECHIDQIGYMASNSETAVYDFRNGRELSEYSLVFLRGKLRMALNDVSLVSYYLEQKGIPVVNSSFSHRGVIGKVPQMFWLQTMGLPIPRTVSAGGQFLPRLVAEHLSFPLILKDVQGSHGSSNYLVNTADELAKIIKGNADVRFMAQEFIPNDGDYRVLIIGDTELIIRRQAAGGTHLNNTSMGGSATLVDPKDFSEEVIKASREFAKSRNYEIAGVDVIFDSNTGKHYFLEINSQPQIASGAFIDEKAQLLGEYFAGLI